MRPDQEPDCWEAVQEAGELLVQVGQELNLKTSARRVQDSLSRLRKRTLRLALFGDYKRGKSTLTNALLGRSVAPVGIIPVTALATFFRFGEEEKIEVLVRGKTEIAPLSDLPRFVSEEANPDNLLGVEQVIVTLNSPILLNGAVLIDTPGIGSIHSHNTKTALDFIPEADVAVLVLGAEPPLGASEAQFIRAARPEASRFLFVQNKVDRLSGEELTDSLRYNESVLSRELGGAVAVIPVAARDALRAQETRDELLLERSNLPKVLFAISAVMAEREGITLQTAKRAMSVLLEQAKSQIRFEEHLETAALADLHDRQTRLTQDFNRLISRKDEVIRSVTETVRQRLNEMLSDDLKAFIDAEGQRLRHLLKEELSKDLAPMDAVGAANHILSTEIPHLVMDWGVLEERKLVVQARERLGTLEQSLAELQSAAQSAVFELFDIRLDLPKLSTELNSKSRFFVYEEKLSLKLSVLERVVLQFGGSWVRSYVMRKAQATASMQLQLHAGRLRADLSQRMQKSLEQCRDELGAAFDDTATSLSSTIARIAAFQSGRSEDERERRAARDSLANRLARVRAVLETD